MQYLLRHWGFNPGAFDGALGSTTDREVRDFQRARFGSADGVVGPGTWGELTKTTLRQGSSGDPVRAMSQLLASWDKQPTFSSFTSAVRSRVVAFQRHRGLGQDGIVGPNTWRHLAFHYDLYSTSNACPANNPNDSLSGPTNRAREGWGTGATTAYINWAASRMRSLRSWRLPMRDVSVERGGDIAGHVSHEHGMDFDAYFYTYDNTENLTCAFPMVWTDSRVRSRSTIELINYIIDASENLGRDLHVITFIEDTIVLRAFSGTGEARAIANHHDHTHTRFCTVYYPYSSLYDC